jgi:hypothetical protein
MQGARLQMQALCGSAHDSEEAQVRGGRVIIGKRDRRVLKAFAAMRAMDGYKLASNGRHLDGLWMGGSRIAEWIGCGGERPHVIFNDLGSRAAQTVQRALRKVVPRSVLWTASREDYYKRTSGAHAGPVPKHRRYKKRSA